MANVKFTPEDIENRIDDYFNYCRDNDKPMTMSGLALFLDCSRTTLYHYENELIKFNNVTQEDKQRILNAIKKAKRMVEVYQEELLLTARNPAGSIFALKNNFENWRDTQEIYANTNVSTSNPIQQLSTEEIKQLLSENKQE